MLGQLCQWKHDYEQGTAPWFALNGDVAAVKPDVFFRDRQPQTRASGIAGSTFLHSVEPVKDSKQLILRDSGTSVFHLLKYGCCPDALLSFSFRRGECA